MGRFASTVEFYARYREPYLPTFFTTVAEQLALRGNESLLDIGCGPGLLAIGFAPFVERCTRLDPEAAMIAAAKDAAVEAGVTLELIEGYIEEFPTSQPYDLITIGRALHWLDRRATLAVLERIVIPESGRILICGASSVETSATTWVKAYEEVRRTWSSEPDEKHYRIDRKKWFAGSCFAAIGDTSVAERREVTIADLIGRALSKSNTSPEVGSEEKPRFEAELAVALEPFAERGVLVEQIVARASIFGRVRSGYKHDSDG